MEERGSKHDRASDHKPLDAHEEWHKKAIRNRRLLREAQNVGCFCCGSFMKFREIRDWTDHSDTGLCPKCGVDSLLPLGVEVPFSINVLRMMYDYYFRWGTGVKKEKTGEWVSDPNIIEEAPREW